LLFAQALRHTVRASLSPTRADARTNKTYFKGDILTLVLRIVSLRRLVKAFGLID